jgi:hypothetical protein
MSVWNTVDKHDRHTGFSSVMIAKTITKENSTEAARCPENFGRQVV